MIGDPEQVVELIEGEELDLECIYSGQPTPIAEWQKDGREVGSHIRVIFTILNHLKATLLQLISSSQFLYTEKVKKSDEGIYLCRVQNAAGTTTKKFDVKVIEKPRLLPTVPETSHIGVNCKCY